MRRNWKILMAIIGIMLLNIMQFIYIQQASQPELQAPSLEYSTAQATAVTRFCINHAPGNLTHSCNMTLQWLQPYACQMSATDEDNNSIAFESFFLTSTSLFNITTGGLINFTPSIVSAGNHTFRILIYDNSNCDNDDYYEDFDMEITTFNVPPQFHTPIQNITLSRGTSFAFDLDDHFDDPNGDNLTYFSVKTAVENYTTISIGNDGFVTIFAAECGVSRAYFVATDEDGLTNTSNTVGYTITGCSTSSSGSSTGGAGSGGSGSGASCVSEWRCGKWRKCTIENITERECVDQNACDPDDYNRKLQKSCIYVPPDLTCFENWDCSDWSECINGTKSRKCLDKNSCGTITGKPEELQSCIGTETCFNGIQDENEEGVDCGGSCTACRQLESPAEIVGRNYLWILIVLASLAAMAAFFRDKIMKLMKKIIGLRKKHEKIIYLNAVQKRKLIDMTSSAQFKVSEKSYKKAKTAIIGSIKSLLLELGIGKDFDQDIKSIKDKSLQKILTGLNHKCSIMLSNKAEDLFEIQEVIDETETIIYLLSEFTDNDAINSIKERPGESYHETPATNLQVMQIKISNAFIALRFDALSEAKKLYKEILMEYELMGEQSRLKLYDDMIRLYNTIAFNEVMHQ